MCTNRFLVNTDTTCMRVRKAFSWIYKRLTVLTVSLLDNTSMDWSELEGRTVQKAIV